MSFSIRTRMIVVINLLVLAVALAAGWGAVVVAQNAIEKRLLVDVADSTCRLLSGMNLPLSDTLMGHLKQIYGADAVAVGHGGAVLGSSLSPEQTAALQTLLRRGAPERGAVTLGGGTYHLGMGRIERARPDGAAEPVRLYLLVPAEQLAAAKSDAARRMAMATLPAIGAATLLAVVLSMTLTRPIRRLAAQMDALAASAGDESAAAAAPLPRSGPAELVTLAESFDHLLERLRQARESLARSHRLATLGKLAASVVHEIRNPLSGIAMNVRVLQDELARHNIDDRSAALIRREIERLDLYIQELMGLAADQAQGPLDAKALAALPPISLSEPADSVADLLQSRCAHAGIEVLRRYEADAPAVRADSGHMRQVIMNLVLNAMAAMPAGGKLTLALATAGGAVRMSVFDTGAGVQAGGQDIFDPFVSTRSDGAGLGLYVCRGIVTRYGGRIGYNPLPQGTEFWFELPGDGTAMDAKNAKVNGGG
ncbi:MAG: HAMP domain-containing protein [Planctomycetaceae bacterium]|nr:HAMP domain-containing protein [Planctomycetaceae bacterium]